MEIGEHFHDFLFDWDHREYVLLGGFGSGKSYAVVMKLILKLLQEKRTALVVRQVFANLRESTFSLFREVIEDMGLGDLITVTVSPMKIVFPNGSEVIFRGLDSPAKLRSINNVSIIFIEEASEISYNAYTELRGRARHPSDSIHFILASNPAPRSNWVYKHYFKDNERLVMNEQEFYDKRIISKDGKYYSHSTVEDNPFLPETYTEALDEMAEYDESLYRTARLGEFGSTGTIVLPQFEVKAHEEVIGYVEGISDRYHRVGMDLGFIESYNVVVRVAIDDVNKHLYIYSEYYSRGKTDDKLVVDLVEFKDSQELIRADNAEPKTIQYFIQEGYRIRGAKKQRNIEQIKKIKRFKKIICSDECKNVIEELNDLSFKEDKDGNIIEDEFTIDSHAFDAIKYALEGYEVANLKIRNNHSGKGGR